MTEWAFHWSGIEGAVTPSFDQQLALVSAPATNARGDVGREVDLCGFQTKASA